MSFYRCVAYIRGPSCPFWPHQPVAPRTGPIPFTHLCSPTSPMPSRSVSQVSMESVSLGTTQWGSWPDLCTPPVLATVGTTQHQEPRGPPEGREQAGTAASAPGPGPRATAVHSGLVPVVMAGQAIHTSICFNLVQQGTRGTQNSPQLAMPGSYLLGRRGQGPALSQGPTPILTISLPN